MIVFLLDIHYWYTRRSTFSISILGTAMISGSELLVELASIVAKSKGLFTLIASLLSAMLTGLVLPFTAIKTILRIKFGWWKEMGWVPTMHRASATRREITSARLETATNWQHKAAVCYFDYRFMENIFTSVFFSSGFPWRSYIMYLYPRIAWSFHLDYLHQTLPKIGYLVSPLFS